MTSFIRALAVAVASLALSIAAPGAARAQDTTRWWVAPAVGGGWSESSGGGLAGNITIGAQKHHIVLSARAATVFNWDSGSGDVGAMLGYGTAGETYHWAASLGAGLSGSGLGQWSVPMELRFSILSRQWIGFSVIGFGAVTEGDSFAAGAIAIPLGHLH